jgi:hypothetical protein
MFSVDRGPDAPDRPLGVHSFQVLADLVGETQGLTAEDPKVHLFAVSLWTFVDGQVHLRASRPRFPWPELDQQLDLTIRTLLGAGKTGP